MPMHCAKTGLVSKLPVDFLTLDELAEFCADQDVRFHALGEPDNWDNPAVFRAATQASPSVGLTIPYTTVRAWLDAKRAIGERQLKGGLYRHYKGGEYTTLGPAVIESSLTPAVLYQGADGTVWVRPEVDFFQVVHLGDGKFTPRFSFVGPA